MKFYLFIAVLASHCITYAQTPAAKVHVRQINNTYVKYTSKLTGVVQLNFTMGFHHSDGKGPTTTALDAAASEYDFTVHKITGANNGTTQNDIPSFTVDDLTNNGQVIVTNNVSTIGSSNLGTSRQNAIQQAIETRGMGYVGNHGSGDNQASGWPWYSNTLYPVGYAGHGNKNEGAPVYKNTDVANHVVLEGLWNSQASDASVLDGLDGNGDVRHSTLKTRSMRMEWYRYTNVDFCPDNAQKQACLDNLTILLKFDPTGLTDNALPNNHRRRGGNIFTFIYKVGQGLTSYFPPGHNQQEFDDFDRGVSGTASSGDLTKYIGQLLMYLAGYNLSVCNESNPCLGLPIVDNNGVMSGDTVDASTSSYYLSKNIDFAFMPRNIGFVSRNSGSYRIQLVNLTGTVLDEQSGFGEVRYSYPVKELSKGLYFLTVQYEGKVTQLKRYAILEN